MKLDLMFVIVSNVLFLLRLSMFFTQLSGIFFENIFTLRFYETLICKISLIFWQIYDSIFTTFNENFAILLKIVKVNVV